MLKGKKIVLGVTGGIAAYKTVELCRLFCKAGAKVYVVMTAAAREFVTPLTFQTVSGRPVYCDMFVDGENFDVRHVGLVHDADLIVIAPATANCLGKIASGICDDLLTTSVIAARCPGLLAPAMNEGMYNNSVLQRNISFLTELGYHFVGPETGALACGDTGIGRMAEATEIFEAAGKLLTRKKELSGKRFLITAGPTHEAIDPVRYVGNRSSGKMGYALAQAAVERGAEVVLVTGPSSLQPPAGADVVRVVSALEMRDAVQARFPLVDVVIMAAAVADFRPEEVSSEKIKKSNELSLKLVKNPDILAELGREKGDVFLTGFAAETHDLQQNAEGKLQQKNLDMIVANDLTQEGAGFEGNTNIAKFLFREGAQRCLPLMSKYELAVEILAEITKRI